MLEASYSQSNPSSQSNSPFKKQKKKLDGGKNTKSFTIALKTFKWSG